MGQQGTVIITGFVGADPLRFGREDSSTACSFRIGSTRRYFHPASGEWREHPTTWITVKAFRILAEHILDSLNTGDPVMVVGLLNTEEWRQDGAKRTRIVIEASGVGHDLLHGTTTFHRTHHTRMTPDTERTTDDTSRRPLEELSSAKTAQAVSDAKAPDLNVDAEEAQGVPSDAEEEFAGAEF